MTAQDLANEIANALKGGSDLKVLEFESGDGTVRSIDPNVSLNKTAELIAQAIIDYLENPEGGHISSDSIPASSKPTPTRTQSQVTNFPS